MPGIIRQAGLASGCNPLPPGRVVRFNCLALRENTMFNILSYFFSPAQKESLKDGTQVVQNGDLTYTVQVTNQNEAVILPLQLEHSVADRLSRLIEAARTKDSDLFWVG